MTGAKHILGLLFLTMTTQAFATSLKDYVPYKYEVLFTNPICKTYTYDVDVESNG